MRPSASTEIRWGLAASGTALVLVAVLALTPDPFFRQRVVATSFDDVSQVSPGIPVYFRGSEVGSVRSVDLDPATRTFAVRFGLRRDWRPTACDFAKINETNPMTPPRIDLVSLEVDQARCPAARAAATCEPVRPARPPTGETITGCQRTPDFFQSATTAVLEVTEVASSANLILARLNRAERPGGGSDLDRLLDTAQSTAAAARELSQRLDEAMAPGKGDLALTLANARRASNQAADIDVASLNASLAQMKDLIAENRQSLAAVLTQSRDLTAEGRTMLETLSASLTDSASALQRTTTSLDALSERLAADPTYAVRGQRFTDPPAPGGSRK
jgi:ABC-type transporter Mla subunit MlaD